MRVQLTFSAVKPAELPHLVDTLAGSQRPVQVRSFGDFTFEVTVPWSEESGHKEGPFMAEQLTFQEINRRMKHERERSADA